MRGEETKIRGVSDSIIVGAPIPIGTGACSVLRDVLKRAAVWKTSVTETRAVAVGTVPQKSDD